MNTLNCALCNLPVDLTIDLACDETGKAVHERCYMDRITGKKDTGIPPPPFAKYMARNGLKPGAVRHRHRRPLPAPSAHPHYSPALGRAHHENKGEDKAKEPGDWINILIVMDLSLSNRL
jgi:hypothetical protein